MVKTKKPEEPVEAEVVEPKVAEPVQTSSERPKRRRHTGSIFWGCAFIFVGALLLLDNLNIISVHLNNLWQLWPIFIIGAGFSMLSIRGWLGGLLAFLLAAVIGTLVFFVAVDNPYYSVNNVAQGQQESTFDGNNGMGDQKELDLTLKTGAVELNIASNPTQQAFMAKLVSRRMVIDQSSTVSRDGIRYVTLETASNDDWWMGMMNSRLTVELTEKMPVSLHIETGASTITADLSTLQLKALTVKAGASTMDFRLGTVLTKQDVTIEAGVSKATIIVPKSAGVRIQTDDGLSHTNFADVSKVSDGVYESAGFATAEKQITIHAKIGVSSFELQRY